MRIAALVLKYWSLFLLNVFTNVKELLSLRLVPHIFFSLAVFFFCVLALFERYVRLILPLVLLFTFSSLNACIAPFSGCFSLLCFDDFFFSRVLFSRSLVSVFAHIFKVLFFLIWWVTFT